MNSSYIFYHFTKHLFSAWYCTPWLVTFNLPIISFEQRRHTEVKQLAQGHRASKKQSWDSNPSLWESKA